jgi:hypothetical protein
MKSPVPAPAADNSNTLRPTTSSAVSFQKVEREPTKSTFISDSVLVKS